MSNVIQQIASSNLQNKASKAVIPYTLWNNLFNLCINTINQNAEVLKIHDLSIDAISAGQVGLNSVYTNAIQADAVTGAKIASGAITTAHFASTATVPIATKAEYLNNSAANKYAPVSVTGGLGTFKERYLDTPLTTVEGKTYNGARYINDNGAIKKLDFTTGALTVVYTGIPATAKLAFDAPGNLHYAYMFVDSNDKVKLSVYKYTGTAMTLLGTVELGWKSTYTDTLINFEFYNNYIYLFRYKDSRSSGYGNDIMEKASSTTFSSTTTFTTLMTYACRQNETSAGFIYANKAYIGNKVYDFSSASESTLTYYIQQPGINGWLKTKAGPVHFCTTVGVPTMVDTSTIVTYDNVTKTFCYNDSIFALFNGYLFKNRIV